MPHWRRQFLQIRARMTAQLAQRSPSENAFLFLLPVVGLTVGLASVGIAHMLAFLQNQFWGGGEHLLDAVARAPRWMRLVVPAIGGLIVGLIGWGLKVQTRGAGTAGMMQAVSLKGGFLSLSETLRWLGAALITIATGGSLGREGPMMRTAGAIGSNIGRRFKLEPRHLRMLVCAAAASALAAVYNSPIGGSIFALEILMGSFALDVFGPVVVASVISTLVFRSAMGSLPRFVIPHYELVSAWELPAYLVLGILGGIVSILFVKAIYLSEDFFDKLPGPRWIRPLIGFALLGGVAWFFPHVLGNGYDTVNMTLNEDPNLTLELLIMLAVAKTIATALTYGAGGAGGLFLPSLMVGALLGGAFGNRVHEWFPHHTAEQGAYALVGMGAILAGTTHAPITAIMMIFEQTNSYQIVLPLMFVCIVSLFTVRLFKGKSLHDEALLRRGITLPKGPEENVMQTMRVADVMHDDRPAVNHSVPFNVVVERFLKEPYNNLYVIDGHGKYLGAIRLHSMKEMLTQGDSLQSVVAHDLIDDTFTFVTPEDNLAATMDKFWKQNCERLPVVDNSTDRNLIGWMSKRDLLGIYSQEILRKRQLLGHFVVTEDGEKRDVFVELPAGFALRSIEIPGHCNGQTLAELAPRSRFGVHVLACKRRDPLTGHDKVELPEAQTCFTTGEHIVVIGPDDAIAKFTAALAG
ncbi:MAG: Voltage-gated ClC-type chloride channel ClcB [Verrucomicrobiae bacterium]|nr:Voltage-gated ClC-type chloride channel ClcB [Verrucomicrobiae bacterium]